jgi:hypothetical protein
VLQLSSSFVKIIRSLILLPELVTQEKKGCNGFDLNLLYFGGKAVVLAHEFKVQIVGCN